MALENRWQTFAEQVGAVYVIFPSTRSVIITGVSGDETRLAHAFDKLVTLLRDIDKFKRVLRSDDVNVVQSPVPRNVRIVNSTFTGRLVDATSGLALTSGTAHNVLKHVSYMGRLKEDVTISFRSQFFPAARVRWSSLGTVNVFSNGNFVIVGSKETNTAKIMEKKLCVLINGSLTTMTPPRSYALSAATSLTKSLVTPSTVLPTVVPVGSEAEEIRQEVGEKEDSTKEQMVTGQPCPNQHLRIPPSCSQSSPNQSLMKKKVMNSDVARPTMGGGTTPKRARSAQTAMATGSLTASSRTLTTTTQTEWTNAKGLLKRETMFHPFLGGEDLVEDDDRCSTFSELENEEKAGMEDRRSQQVERIRRILDVYHLDNKTIRDEAIKLFNTIYGDLTPGNGFRKSYYKESVAIAFSIINTLIHQGCPRPPSFIINLCAIDSGDLLDLPKTLGLTPEQMHGKHYRLYELSDIDPWDYVRTVARLFRLDPVTTRKMLDRVRVYQDNYPGKQPNTIAAAVMQDVLIKSRPGTWPRCDNKQCNAEFVLSQLGQDQGHDSQRIRRGTKEHQHHSKHSTG